MNDLTIFESPEFGSIRTVEENGKVLFCGSDVAKALGYLDTPKAIKTHCKEDGWVIYPVTDSLGREQQAKFITEGNVYRLITHSKLPTAEKFEIWVFDDVLPTIRKTGGYVSDDEMFINTYLPNADEATKVMFRTNLATIKNLNDKVGVLETENALQKQQIAELQPKASYYDVVINSKDLMSITEIAKDYGKSGMWLNNKLHELKVQFKQGGKIWLLYQKYANNGYTSTKTQTYNGNDGQVHTKVHTYWTQAGRLFIYDLLKQHEILPLIERDNNA